ncbi:MAG: glycoside hydrolase family 57 protein [Planctomycetota bacterium]|nr:glycoside hydrolase family 57 protein [Planctomycetota bacterium]MDI6786797.1 glycoside hydrolase family 57 protein [Planctomycetota bacterium]
MAKKIFLAFLWHHHQPCYRLTDTGEFQMPWVRLHGVKDYYGMASLIRQFPKIRATINLVPVLLKQIEEYLAGDSDRLFSLLQKPASDLSPEDKEFILENGFSAHQHMISTSDRYKELYLRMKDVQRGGVKEKIKASEQDFIDLLTCSNLVWFHPLIMQEDTDLQGLREKGRNYTEDDRKLIAQKQLYYLSRIIPLHKELQDSGQIEITTSAFYHPILPLLCNIRSTLEAMPNLSLGNLDGIDQRALMEDASSQVAGAVKFYKERFGRPCSGFWPPEGSVSPVMIPLLSDNGIEYFATDEEILAHTIGKPIDHSSGVGLDALYQPYRLRNLSVIFRDQNLSNLISFQYQRWKPQDAVDHFIKEIKNSVHNVHYEYPLVSVILDGENPWEHYPNNGIEFLRLLYERLSNDPEIETVRISDYLEKHPPQRQLDTIYSGSWINHNFSIWIGDGEDQKGWEYIARTKEAIKEYLNRPISQVGLPETSGEIYLLQSGKDELVKKAQENIYIAEGSDWFWWFGEEHLSVFDEQFDALFRKHLMNVYQILGMNIPEYLYQRIRHRRKRELYTHPCGLLDIKLDGRCSDYFEWLSAGQFDASNNKSPISTMSRSNGTRPLDSDEAVSRIFFGFDREKNLCIRIDYNEKITKTDGVYFVLNFLKPLKRKVIIQETKRASVVFPPEADQPPAEDENNNIIQSLNTVAIDEIIEILCPLDILGFKHNDEIEFFVEVYSSSGRENEPCPVLVDKLLARYPDSQMIKLTVPAETAECIDWIA